MRLRGDRVLPPRDGIAAARLRAPGGPQTHPAAGEPVPATIGEWLTGTVIPTTMGREQAFGEKPLPVEYFVGEGMLTSARGERVRLGDAVDPGGFYFFHKPYPPEKRVPFEIDVLYEDRELLVVDKPHFLSSTPNGRFVRECVVTRLRVERGEDDLVAVHRLDRVTGGLLVLSRRPTTRGAYQLLFQERRIRKTYRALAWLPQGWRRGDPLPLGLEPGGSVQDMRSRLQKIDGERQVRVVAGEANAHTGIRLDRIATTAGGRGTGEFTLTPHTGKTHQLRVHLNSLGMPIVGDPVYPVDLEHDPYDFRSPLRLLASRLRFADPLTGARRRFESRMTLAGE